MKSRRIWASLFDFFFLYLNVQFAKLLFAHSYEFEILVSVLIPVIAWVPYAYLLQRFFRQTFGQYLFGLERTVRGSDAHARRIYDWIFNTDVRSTSMRLPGWQAFFCLIANLALGLGLSTAAISQDLTLRKWKQKELVAFIPDTTNPATRTQILPLYYALAAIPDQHDGVPLQWSLPYERRSQSRQFLGKIVLKWNDELDASISFSGPLTFKRNVSTEQWRACLLRLAGCRGLRSELIKTYLKNLTDWGRLEELAWVEVSHPFLKPHESPRGILISGPIGNHSARRRTVFLLLNPNLSYQAITLDRPATQAGARAEDLFYQIISSIRVTSELAAPRTWIDGLLSQFRPAQHPSLAEVTQAQKLLLSKLTVNPDSPEPYYHLFKFTEIEYDLSLAQNELKRTASARKLFAVILSYAREVGMKGPQLAEIEQKVASTEKK